MDADREFDRIELMRLEACLEAVLFSSGEPMSAQRLAQALEVDVFTLKRLLTDLKTRLDTVGGLALFCVEDRYQLTTRPETAECVRRAMEIKRDIPLSQAAFEVLAVIAYRQPVTRAYIEQIRGVDCSAVVTTLVQKGLIEEKGRLELPGRPLLYGTTDNFLRCFGIENIENLPDISSIEMDAGEQQEEIIADGEQLSITDVGDTSAAGD